MPLAMNARHVICQTRFLWLQCLVLCLLNGCSSLHRKAEKLYESGAYQGSIDTYDEILKKDPADADAVIGRLKARAKLIDTKLIEIRRSRLAGNEENAIEMLRHLVDEENEWATFPKGAVAYTQEEESTEALKFVDGQVKEALADQFPLRASYRLKRYQMIFQGTLSETYDRMSGVVREAGKQSCRSLADGSGATRPYFGEFLQKYCAHWGLSLAKVKPDEQRKLKKLYRGTKVQVKVENLPPEVISIVQENIDEGLKQTPWFDVKGARVLPVQLQGKYQNQHHEEVEMRLHSYTVQIPYTSYEPVQRERQVPYTDTQIQCVPNPPGTPGQNCNPISVTKYRTEQYWENEPVTRYRDEPRTQSYDGLKISQLLNLNVEGKALFSGTSKIFNLSEKSNTSGFESEWSLPKIGLYPQHAGIPDPLSWIKLEVLQLGENFQSAANNFWEINYCHPVGKDLSFAVQGDQVHRCLRRRPTEIPRFVALWYENNLGVTVSQADELLGLKDL